MPSGAKRRKAAKKKKEKIGNVNDSSSSSQQGNGYSPKSHDDKDSHSDSGDTCSPAGSLENRNPFSKEEQEERLDEVKGVLKEPQSVEIEKSEVGDEAVTKEVDVVESRVVDVESVKDPDVKGFGGSEKREDGEVVEKKEALSESNGGKTDIDVVEIDVAVEPIEEVVSLTKELIHDPEKQIACQSDEVVRAVDVVRAVEVSPMEKTGGPGGIELQLNDREGDVLPQSNGTVVETSNGTERPVESHTCTSTENQQKDVASVRPTVRPTSWKSCCGIFDVLTGSNR